MISHRKTILKITAGKPGDGFRAEIIAPDIRNISWSVADSFGEEVLSGISDSTEICAEFEARMWSVGEPVLYTFKAVVTYENGETEEISDRFGFRYFDTDEKYIYLNGFPFYMRAYIRGAAAHEHQNNCNLSEYEFYRKNIRMAKSYGFNTIRFHSVIPPEECFRAADEEGILIHIEMRKENDNYDNLQEMLYGKNDFITDEALLEIIHTLYNHPSFMVYCVGNEIREPGKKPRIKEIRDFIKKNDPTRLFIDTCAHGEYDRDGVDFDVQHMGYFFPYGRNGDMFANTDNLLCFGTVNNREMVREDAVVKLRRRIRFNRPLIAHEVCHYVSWRDYYALREKFEKYNIPAPWWVEEEIKMLEAKGYREKFGEILQMTKDFQFRCWKTAIEGIRASNILSGFHMLQFADTDKYENSNGVVDCFDDPHGISQEEFSKFNADAVVLARLPKAVYRVGESVKIPVLLSQYTINPPETGEFSYTLSGESVYSTGTLAGVETNHSGISEICSLDVTLPETQKSEKLTLSCTLLFEDGTKCENSWELWVFPDVNEISATVKMTGDYICKAFEIKENENLVITDRLDDCVFDELEKGKNVMLIYRSGWTRHLLDKTQKSPQYAFKAVWERYKGVIWDRGTINGGFDKKELLEKYGFATDGQLNFQYYNLVDDSDKINLDDIPFGAESIISGIDKANRDRFDATKFRLPELMYDRTMRHFSYAFELKVGGGKLLVTGLNFTSASENPAVRSMVKALADYCCSDDFNPEYGVSANDLKSYLTRTAQSGPNKEGMMTQYWQLDAEPVESMEYWEESERYLREDMK